MEAAAPSRPFASRTHLADCENYLANFRWNRILDTSESSANLGYSDLLSTLNHAIFRPIMKSVCANVKFYMEDFLCDYDMITRTAAVHNLDSGNFLLGFVGIRPHGTDGVHMFKCRTEGEPVREIYADVFMLEAVTIDNNRTIIVWRMDI